MRNKENYQSLQKTDYVIPFGTFAEVKDLDFCWVGRKGRFAFFLDRLFHQRQRGVFLVTGRRGSGKTSFVERALQEYEESVFKRFLNSQVARGFLDRLAVLFVWFLVLFGILLLSKSMQALGHPELLFEPQFLPWLLISPIALVCMYPCVHAQHLLDSASCGGEESPQRERGRWQATFRVILVSLVVWFFGPFGNLPLGVGRLFVVLGGLYYVVQSFPSFFVSASKNSMGRRLLLWSLTALSTGYVVMGPTAFLMLSEARLEFWFNAFLGLVFLSLGAILQVLHQASSTNSEKQAAPSYLLPAILFAVAAGVLWISGLSSDLRFVGLQSLFPLLLPLLWKFLRNLVAAGGAPQTDPDRLRPKALFCVKAVWSIAIALQLAQPALTHILYPSEIGQQSKIQVELPQQLVTAFDLATKDNLARRAPSVGGAEFKLDPQEIQWIVTLLLMIIALQYLEYEWVLRSTDGDKDNDEKDDGEERAAKRRAAEVRKWARNRWRLRQERLTFPWIIFHLWSPLMVIRINLGFDKIDHRRVVQAMLADLRDAYHRTFLAWNSGLATIGRFAGGIFLVLAVMFTCHSWFRLDPAAALKAKENAYQLDREFCQRSALAPGATPGAADLVLCGLGAEPVLEVLYFELITVSTQNTATSGAEDTENSTANNSADDTELRPLTLRFYHLVLYLGFFLCGRWFFASLPIFPYSRNLKRIDDLLEGLSSKTTQTSQRDLWKPAEWVHSFLGTDSTRQFERGPIEPQTVEIAFLQILADIQQGGIYTPGAAYNQLSLPVPEIIFVFDELDKLGTRSDPGDPASAADTPTAERKRTSLLDSLLSDLKNIFSSAHARFVFVGARNLHDEWLADQTTRLPLLSNIFDAEIYLPSLMLDHRRGDKKRLHHWIEEYVMRRYWLAQALYESRSGLIWRPFISLLPDSGRPSLMDVNQNPSEALKDTSGKTHPSLYKDFIDFLTYRSQGHPRRLQDLLATFVRPIHRAPRIENPNAEQHDEMPCDHVLQLNNDAVFRIQLVVDLYRHVRILFEERLLDRDDKLALSVFHMVDFMLKFHRRAFSWHNLERTDELLHIHRAPDLRLIVEELITHCSERFLHRVGNGLYDFRFNSGIAREVEYISRQSAEEMAAFNFTLDESQSLKAYYQEMLEQSAQDGSVTREIVTNLGELHEFDQEYEQARRHYRRALRILDDDLRTFRYGPQNAVNPVTVEDDSSSILEIFTGGRTDHARYYMSWGVVRLRLLLRIAMTLEHTRDMRQAIVEYGNARILARRLLAIYLEDSTLEKSHGKAPTREHLHHELKQVRIFFQAAFAEAWALEKTPESLDTGIALVEEELAFLRQSLPFVGESSIPIASDPLDLKESNFALIMADLHIKTGALYFFKGGQKIPLESIGEMAEKEIARAQSESTGEEGGEGYLLRAHYHCIVALNDLRRCLRERRINSKGKLNIFEKGWNTILKGHWPDQFIRLIAGIFEDLAEITIAGVSFFALLSRLQKHDYFESEPRESTPFVENIRHWLEEDPSEPRIGNQQIWVPIGEKFLNLGTFSEWFGLPDSDGPITEKHRFTFCDWLHRSDTKSAATGKRSSPHYPEQRLALAVQLWRAGAKLLEEAGYLEDAAQANLRICEAITQYLWWAHGVNGLKEWYQGDKNKPFPDIPKEVWNTYSLPFWDHLFEEACEALKHASRLFHQGRREDLQGPDSGIVGPILPTYMVTLACSVGLAASQLSADSSVEDKSITTSLFGLLEKWQVLEKNEQEKNDFHLTLKKVLQQHSYPMINRLHGLKVLIDSEVLQAALTKRPETEVLHRLLDQAEDLLAMKENFKAPLHFTPFHSGVTFAQLVFVFEERARELDEKKTRMFNRLRREAQFDLRTSGDLFTQRRAFYLAMSDLYYLYDDFDDPQIHFNHAIQMAGSEWATVLESLVEDETSKRDSRL